MVDVDRAVIARLKKGGHTFEILVDCDNALAYKQGKTIPLGDIVATSDIFKDVKNGEKASEHVLHDIFNTTDVDTISAHIIKEGEVQLTAHHRAKLREEKKKRIISIIHSNAIDSQTGHPHPPQRIEAAMDEAKIHIDDYKTPEEQVESILKKIRTIIPIKFEVREVAVKIPAQYAGHAYTILKRHKLLKDEWQNDGSLIAVVELPAGIQEDFLSDLNKVAHGEVEAKILKTS